MYPPDEDPTKHRAKPKYKFMQIEQKYPRFFKGEMDIYRGQTTLKERKNLDESEFMEAIKIENFDKEIDEQNDLRHT